MKTISTAIVGAGMSGTVAARTLVQAGHSVELFEKSLGVGGRMSTRRSPYGGFDHGAQYFTVRDQRLALALQTVPGSLAHCRPWSANAVRVLDASGHVVEASLPGPEAHWVGSPGMSSLVKHWAQPLSDAGCVQLGHQVQALHRANNGSWNLAGIDDAGLPWHREGFDRVLLAMPAPQARALLTTALGSAPHHLLSEALSQVSMAPCWTLMVAFPQASQPGLYTLGPQWNAARSVHHRVAWLARESSKPGRTSIERWTIQASAEWSQEHINDDPQRAADKLLRAFAELTNIHATPTHAQAHLWRYAKTLHPLGRNFQWDKKAQLGTCGDWHIGHRVEDAFVSGLELALAVCQANQRV